MRDKRQARRSRFRTRKRLVLVVAITALLAGVATAVAATGVEYFNGTARTSTAYSNFVLGNKTYNEMYAGSVGNCGQPVGIYELTSGGSKIRAVNGCGYVYLTHPTEYARAYCWNRGAEYQFLAKCRYVRP